MWPVLLDTPPLQAEIERFEEEVIRGGPVALPGAIDLLSKVMKVWMKKLKLIVSDLCSSTLSKPTGLSSRLVSADADLIFNDLMGSHPLAATNYYAPRALQRCKIPLPDVNIVTSNDVAKGKPHPEPYTAGATRCRVEPTTCAYDFFFFAMPRMVPFIEW